MARRTPTPSPRTNAFSGLVAGATTAFLGSLATNLSMIPHIADNPNLQFPEDLSDSYYMGFMFSAYRKAYFDETPSKSFIEGTRLPIPNSLTNDHSVNYKDFSMTGAISGLLENIAGKENAAAANKLLGGVAFASGATVNPFLSVLFESPKLKTHTFSWKLTPKNKNESYTITKIVKSFQKNMLPSASSGTNSVVLAFPSFVDVFLVAGGGDINLYQFKTCVITDFKVNYAPNGPAFFDNISEPATPASVDISVSLKEIEMWVSEDIK
jgi:hypothetical protein